MFDPELLVPIIEEISGCLGDIEQNSHLVDLGQRPVAVDGTLLHAMPKMLWALWRDEENRAVKVHLHLDLLKGTPERATVTQGNASEIDELMKNLLAGRLYITDRGYFSFPLMAEILKAGSSFLGRVRNNMVFDTLEERPISEEDARSGIRRPHRACRFRPGKKPGRATASPGRNPCGGFRDSAGAIARGFKN